MVRAAAIEALGNMNGTALAIDPSSGRILAMVNQKLALSSGAEPCSTIKLTVALAALEEGLVKHDTPVSLGGGYRVDLDYALAKSVNPYFEVLGRTMGFERVKHYANEFGLGELAGYGIAGEQLGVYPDVELPAKLGGVGADVLVWREHLDDAAAAGRDCFSDCEWRDALLSPAPGDAAGGEELSAQGKADTGYCADSAGDDAGDARGGGGSVGNGAEPEGELQCVSGDGQDGERARITGRGLGGSGALRRRLRDGL